jgi:hypothetical protein
MDNAPPLPPPLPKLTHALEVKECVVLGGSGYPFGAGAAVNLRFDSEALIVRSLKGDTEEVIPYLEIVDITIAGPGSVTTGGGFIGGGFGAQGAVEGMLIASVLNGLTTKTKVHTFLSLITHLGELHVHYGGMEPNALRIALAGVFALLRKLDPVWVKGRCDRLEALREQNLISDEECESLRLRMFVPPDRTNPLVIDHGPMACCPGCAESIPAKSEECPKCFKGLRGKCPSCDKTIPLLSEECRECGAVFVDGAAWKVKPL